MRLLDRYLLRELLIPLGVILGALVLLIDAFDLCTQLHQFQDQKLFVKDVAEYYLVKAPETLVFLAPIVLLLGMLYALTHHSRHNELTAIRAAGVSLWRLSVPYFAVGLLCTAGYFALNELWVPGAADKVELILNRRTQPSADTPKTGARNDSFSNSRDNRFWHWQDIDFNSATMRVAHVDWTSPDGSHAYIVAKRAVWTNEVWTFYDVNEQTFQGRPPVKLTDVSTSEMAMPEFSETPRQMKSWLNIKSRGLARSAHSVKFPISDILDYIRLTPKGGMSREDRASLYTQLNGRLAAPWTCLVAVLIALPFGAAPGRRNVFVGVASSIVIFFAYYILLQVGLALGTGGYIPAWVAGWMPNVTFAAVGLFLTFRVQ